MPLYKKNIISSGSGSGSGSGNSRYQICDWENDTVVNTEYEYGDIRRYGAKCDGETDDSMALQNALNVCSPNNVTVILPNKITLIEQPIILENNANIGWKYCLKGTGENVDTCCILQRTPNLFVGENFNKNVPEFTRVAIDFDNVNVRCSQAMECVCFKAIVIYASNVRDCRFYTPHVLIEGAITTGTIFMNNRIHGFGYTVISGISIYNQEYTFDMIKQRVSESGFVLTDLDDALVISSPSNTTYARYNTQCNDGWFNHNYIAGRTSGSSCPNAVFTIESIDPDFIIDGNWFEFCKYVFSRNIRDASQAIVGTNIINNTFQYFHRFFDPRGRYSRFRIQDNTFSSFSTTRLKGLFTKVTNDEDFDNYISGVLVGVITEEKKPYMTNIHFYNNLVYNSDYSIHIDNGNSGASFRVSCHERGNIYDTVTNPPYIRLRSIKEIFNGSYYEVFDNIQLENTSSIIDRTAYVNAFIGQTVYVNGVVYKVLWDNTQSQPYLVPLNNLEV